MDINHILFYIASFDAGAVLLMGIISALLMLFDYKAEKFWARVWPATGILVATSLGAGVIVWIADYFLI